MPAPNRSPPTATVAWNRLWWSGPLRQRTRGREPVVCRTPGGESCSPCRQGARRLVDAFAELLKHEATDRLDTAVEVLAEHGLDRISQDRRLLSTAGGTAFAKAQIESDPEFATDSLSVSTTRRRPCSASCPSGRSGKAENRWSVPRHRARHRPGTRAVRSTHRRDALRTTTGGEGVNSRRLNELVAEPLLE